MTVEQNNLATISDKGRKLTLLALRLITVAMFYILGLGMQYAIHRFYPGSSEEFLPIVIAVVSIESIFTYTRTKDLEGREKTLFRISELLTIAILLKAFLLFQSSELDLAAELTSWQNDFMLSFINGPFLTHLLIILAVWGCTTYLLSLFDQLHERELDASWEDAGKLSNSLKNIRNQMSAVLTVMLIFLIVMTTISSVAINIPDLLSFEATDIHPTWLVMLFTVFLMIQFSLTQFVLLRSRWELDRAVMTRAVPRQWLIYGLIFLIIIGVLAAFLPTRYTVSFFDLLAGLITFLTQIFGFIFYLLTLPFIFLMRLFSNQEAPAPEAPPLDLPTVTPEPNSPLVLPPIFEIIRIMLFWGAFIAVIVFAFYQFISANKDIWKSIASFPAIRWLSRFFEQIKALFNRASRTLQEQIKRIQISRLQGPSIRLPGFRQPPIPKDPRSRIIVLYRSLVDYAGNQGIKRQDYQTPYQYEEMLEGNLPEVTKEVTDVTEGFVEARYSKHAIADATADQLTSEYTQIKKSLDNRPNQ